MQTCPRRPDQLRQARLNIHVNIFKLRVKNKLPVIDFALDNLQPGDDFVSILRRNDALAPEHSRMRYTARDIIGI